MLYFLYPITSPSIKCVILLEKIHKIEISLRWIIQSLTILPYRSRY
nr:MAG TPA_asm: hypothetical protein [Caudoviricetes sp.]